MPVESYRYFMQIMSRSIRDIDRILRITSDSDLQCVYLEAGRIDPTRRALRHLFTLVDTLLLIVHRMNQLVNSFVAPTRWESEERRSSKPARKVSSLVKRSGNGTAHFPSNQPGLWPLRAGVASQFREDQ